jgi:hypothetical protein
VLDGGGKLLEDGGAGSARRTLSLSRSDGKRIKSRLDWAGDEMDESALGGEVTSSK